jgi:predicted O-linked N-acetylglucosamine transferase (SPINDLY family)
MDTQEVAAQVEANFQKALALHQQGRLDDARVYYEQALRLAPSHFNALHLFGLLCLQANLPQHAVDLLAHAVRVSPQNAMAHHNYANALCQLQRYESAIDSYDRAIALDATISDAHHSRGVALFYLKQPQSAVASYDKALALEPKNGAAHYNRGLALAELQQYSAAGASYEAAVGLTPDNAELNTSLGNALRNMRRFAAALASYDRAVAIDANYADAYNQGGVALQILGRFSAAVASFDKAIALNPGNADFHYNRALALHALNQHAAAIASYDNVLRLNPNYRHAQGQRVLARMQICDWDGLPKEIERLTASIRDNRLVSVPFTVLAFSSAADLQKKSAEIFTREEFPARPSLPPLNKYSRHERIRVGYFSSAFRAHATSYLMAEVFEKHDRKRFEFTAFSFGPDSQDAMRKRVGSVFENFIDVSGAADEEIALLARERQIDIAIDLNGLTQDCRPGIFAVRAAPLQVSYLGYPGTMGASYIDYLIADNTLIPENSRQFYREKIIYLPNSYQPNDGQRAFADNTPSRSQLELPEKGFVFCCFNGAFKIAPATFERWMQILKHVEGGVLWLLADNPSVIRNLKSEAAHRGVDPERLIFASQVPHPEHLARYRAADLFLDTQPCNAHTTASDALWAGLPVLTSLGEAFASRVAGSLLNAVGLPELIAPDVNEYQELAIALANNPQRLAAIKLKLVANRQDAALFDSTLITRHLESAYERIYAAHQAELPSGHIQI